MPSEIQNQLALKRAERLAANPAQADDFDCISTSPHGVSAIEFHKNLNEVHGFAPGHFLHFLLKTDGNPSLLDSGSPRQTLKLAFSTADVLITVCVRDWSP